MFQGFYGLLTVMLCVLFAIVVVLFNIAPITYIVFGIAIVSSVFLQYRRFKKQSISERTHSRLAYALFIIMTLSIYWLVADWIQYDLNTTVDQFEDFEYSTTDWKRGWPNNSELPEGLKSPEQLSEGIDKVSMVRTDVAWATAYPYRYVVLEGDPIVIAQYEAIAKQNAAYTAQIDADGVLRELDTGEKKRFISHPNSYRIIESVEEEPLNLPKRSFIEWLRFAPRKETKRVVNDTYNSTKNHRLYVFVDDGNTKRPHFVELLISNDGTRAVFYQSK
ncbi:MAG: hypothetical protein KH619_07845 [Veillonella sp.]|uniref:hypothetical protein n=1 Tax=Veillonella sp. TaxID=1926307 RepID=UPI00291390D4|nr:hypothetical protein [Veillonella sp.]MBS6149364.1 hypothetical protein [Veillonella sp.]MDU3819835.1 hypothetical protein [Veillonella sp.]MDU7877007.1 hypothetical protein [Veillonella sp.]MDU7937249.1 hypothetical protein [Veillonella sp.]